MSTLIQIFKLQKKNLINKNICFFDTIFIQSQQQSFHYKFMNFLQNSAKYQNYNHMKSDSKINFHQFYGKKNNQTQKTTPKASLLLYQAAQKAIVTKIQNLNIYSPYQPYDTQKSYMTYIIKCLNTKVNGVIQSPTGTGKTLSLLSSCLAWQHNQYLTRSAESVPQIYYTSRTHQQLKQTISQLKKLPYKLKISIMSSRQHSCVNNDLKQLTGKDKGFECRKRIMHKEGKSCLFYKQDKFYDDLDINGKILDLDQIVLRSKIQKYCPYYYNKHLKNQANIIFMPYNYLFQNKYSLQQNGISLQNSILIIDEAHNIQQVLQQSKQYTLTLNILSRALSQISQLHQQKITQMKSKQIIEHYSNDIQDMGQPKWKKNISSSLQSIQYHASYITMIHYYFQTIDIPIGSQGKLFTIEQFIAIIQKATKDSEFLVITNKLSKMVQDLKVLREDLKFRPFWAVQSWANFIQITYQLYQIYQNDKTSSKFKIQILYEGSDIKLNIFCLDPSIAMKCLIGQNPHSIILTSGTLSPIKSFTMQLKLQDIQPVSCPHIIQPHQAKTYIVTKGPNNININFSYQNRYNNKVYTEMGLILTQIVRNTPNGIVVFFPSYMLLQQTVKHLNSAKLLSKIYQHKSLHIQTKQNCQFTATLQRYLKDAQSSKGAVLFALIRGKISEGLDFADQKCRAVVVVGVPYPARKDIKVVSKIQYLNQLCQKEARQTLSGQKWYLSQAIRSINQGIGRIIRHKKDYGTIYLLDQRYQKQKPDLKGQLSSWARATLNVITKYSDLADQFKRTKQQSMIKKFPQNTGPNRINGLSNFKSISGGFKSEKQKTNNNAGNVAKSLKSMLAQLKNKKETKIQEKQHHINGQNQEKPNFQINSKQKQSYLRDQSVGFNKKIKEQQKSAANKEVKLQKQDFNQAAQEKQKMNILRVNFNKDRKIIPPDQMQQCPICKTNQKLIKNTVCSHSFCQDCWKSSLKLDLRCPMCRTRIRQKFLVIE